MPAVLPINAYGTSNAYGSFVGAETTGLFQGVIYDSPVETFKIAGAIVGSTETLPMFGGIAVTESIANPAISLTSPTPSANLGNVLTRATATTNITGFTVFNMGHSLVNYPGNPVPLAGSGNGITFVRKNSGVRLAVACDPAIASLETGAINANVSWDFNNNMLQPYIASGATVSVNSATWSANVYTLNVTTSSLPWTIVAGDMLNVSGATNTGTGGNTAVNGNFLVLSTSVSGSNTLINLSLPAAAGVIGTIAGTILLNVGTGAFGYPIIEIRTGNSYVVKYNPATAMYEWNRTGSCAVIVV